MTPAPSSGIPHDTHDRILLASFAAGDAVGSDLVRAHGLEQTCAACASLVLELQAIRSAVATMPPPMERPRDFRIPADVANRIGGAVGWRRLLRPFAARRAILVGPVAATLMTLGLAGLIVSAGAAFPFATGAASGAGGQEGIVGPAAASMAPEASGRNSAYGPDYGIVDGSNTPADLSGGVRAQATDAAKHGTLVSAPTETPDRTWLPIPSGLLLIAGLALVVLPRLALRRR